MDIWDTIQKPWKNPANYSELVFWTVLFLVAVYAMFDGLRIASLWAVSSAKDMVN